MYMYVCKLMYAYMVLGPICPYAQPSTRAVSLDWVGPITYMYMY